MKAEAAGSEWVVPIGKAKIERVGKDVTIISFSRLVGECMVGSLLPSSPGFDFSLFLPFILFFCIAAEKLEKEHGISAEVINLRTIRPLDRDTIINSVRSILSWPPTPPLPPLPLLLPQLTVVFI